MVSVDVKHHVYLLTIAPNSHTNLALKVGDTNTAINVHNVNEFEERCVEVSRPLS